MDEDRFIQDRFIQKGRNVKGEIEQKILVLKQLEGVYRTSTNPSQRSRVLKEINDVKKSIKSLQTLLSIQEEYGLVEAPQELPPEEQFTILNFIKISRHSDIVKDIEMDAVTSYTDFFERNYLPILSEYYIKLDYSHSLKRDTFYPRFMEIKKLLKEYDYELEIQNREEYNTIALFKDKSIVHKMRQRYLLTLDKYFKDLRNFVKLLIDDHRKGGNIVLHPYQEIVMNEFEEDRRLDGYTVYEALEEMYVFFDEFIRFLGMPNI
jgi:hypothetical protein